MEDNQDKQYEPASGSMPPLRRKRRPAESIPTIAIDMTDSRESADELEQNILEIEGLRKSRGRRLTATPITEPINPAYFPKAKYGPFRVQDKALYGVETKDGGEEKKRFIGHLVYIAEILHRVDVEPVEIYLKLRYWYHSQWEELVIPRNQLQVNELSKLMISGVDVASHKVKQVAMFLDYQEKDAPKRYEHTSLGWEINQQQDSYKHAGMIGESRYPSIYGGDYKLSNGSYQGWVDVISEEVIGHPALEFALVAGLSAPLVSWIARDFDMEVLVLHVYGDSSKGKTTAARLFVSPFGRPARKDGGLILNWKATQNNMIGRIANNHGLPMALDEASMNKMSDFTEIIYLLAEGKEKGRMTKELRLRAERTWSGTFFSTAEHSLLMKSNQNTGLYVRLQEFGNVDWTVDGPHAIRLKTGLLEHYGHAGPLFVQHLIELGKPKVFELVAEWGKKLHASMPSQDGKSQRMSEKYGMLLATAELANQCFPFKIDLERLEAFLLEQYQTVAALGEYEDRAYAALKQLVMQHHTKFARDSNPPIAHVTWGKIFKKGKGVEVAFIKQVFKAELAALGFENPDQLLSKWKAKGLLVAEEGKNTKKRTIPGIASRDMYVVKFDENMLEPIEQSTIPHRISQPKQSYGAKRPRKLTGNRVDAGAERDVQYTVLEEEVNDIEDM